MDYAFFSRIITVVASIAITIGLYHQGIKIWRTKSVTDFSWIIVVALLFNDLAWLNYGLSINEWPIIVVSIANLPATVMVGVGYQKFRGGTNENRNSPNGP